MQIIVDDVTEFGKRLARGFLLALCELALCFSLALLAINFFGYGTDDSDFSGWKRSGLKVHTDARTGLQYLSDGKGALIPRVDREGRQLMVESEGQNQR